MSSISYLATLTFFIILFSFTSNVSSNRNLNTFLHCLNYDSNTTNSIENNNTNNKVIYHPDDPSFSHVLQAYIRNERFNQSTTPKPLLIIVPRDPTNVQATVICAKQTKLHIRIRSGGHDYEGLSYRSLSNNDSFVLLDMSNLRSIDIDMASETVWAQAGATLGELYYKIGNTSKKHAFPAGVCTTLGLGGHISGGGYGNMIRKYGISTDNVIDAKVVNANGDILDRQTMGEDLFWAIRGGGAASFAVVISWKLKLVRVPEIVTAFSVGRTLEENVTDIVIQWQDFAPKAEKDLFIRAQPEVINGTRKGSKTVLVSFIAMYLGRAENLVRYLNESFPLLGLRLKDCKEMPWIESTLPPGTSIEDLLNRASRAPYFGKFRSDYVQKPISKSGFELIWKKMIELEVIFMQFNPYGGRVSEIREDETPFPHRSGNLFKVQYLGVWHVESMGDRYINATRELYDTMAPFVSKNPREHYLNYRDIDVGTNEYANVDFAKSYFKGNLPRLLATKAKVDPDNFFRYEQSIPVFAKIQLDQNCSNNFRP